MPVILFALAPWLHTTTLCVQVTRTLITNQLAIARIKLAASPQSIDPLAIPRIVFEATRLSSIVCHGSVTIDCCFVLCDSLSNNYCCNTTL